MDLDYLACRGRASDCALRSFRDGRRSLDGIWNDEGLGYRTRHDGIRLRLAVYVSDSAGLCGPSGDLLLPVWARKSSLFSATCGE